MSMETRYIVIGKGGTLKLTKQDDGFWHDALGTIYAFKDGLTSDPTDRCGVAPFALPLWPYFQDMNDSCKPHDFAYSSPVYQAFHTREEADDYLEELLDISNHPILSEIFEGIARLAGAGYWERDETNN